jgi:hypothetical protein
LSGLGYAELKRYKAARLAAPVVHIRNWRVAKPQTTVTERTIVSVHRELQLLRAMFNRAIHHGWLERNPFAGGDPLINMSVEVERMRILTRAEEAAQGARKPPVEHGEELTLRHEGVVEGGDEGRGRLRPEGVGVARGARRGARGREWERARRGGERRAGG